MLRKQRTASYNNTRMTMNPQSERQGRVHMSDNVHISNNTPIDEQRIRSTISDRSSPWSLCFDPTVIAGHFLEQSQVVEQESIHCRHIA